MFVEVTHASGETSRIQVRESSTLSVGWSVKVRTGDDAGDPVFGDVAQSETFSLTDVVGLALVSDDEKPAKKLKAA